MINFTFFKKKNLFVFRERGREGEREGEKHECVVASCALPTWPATRACALTGNQTRDPLVRRLVLNPLSHTSQGINFTFDWLKMFSFYLKKKLTQHY